MPNETLVTTTVLNHSHAAPQIRIAMHGAGRLRRRRRAGARAPRAGGARATRACSRRRRTRPAAFVAGFADTGVKLELGGVGQRSADRPAQAAQRVHRAILRPSAAHGIAIAYPHRDVRPGATPGQPSRARRPGRAARRRTTGRLATRPDARPVRSIPSASGPALAPGVPMPADQDRGPGRVEWRGSGADSLQSLGPTSC